jgi:hypothetical protein
MFARSIGLIGYFGGSPITLAFPSMSLQESWAALITTSPWTAPLVEHCLTQDFPGLGSPDYRPQPGITGTAPAGVPLRFPRPGAPPTKSRAHSNPSRRARNRPSHVLGQFSEQQRANHNETVSAWPSQPSHTEPSAHLGCSASAKCSAAGINCQRRFPPAPTTS